MEDMFRFADEFGPARIIHIHRSHVGLKAIAVVDNTACGPAIGGVRMAPDVSTEECFRLARAMTWKNAAAGLPHGGGKSVIFGGRPPSIPCARRANASKTQKAIDAATQVGILAVEMEAACSFLFPRALGFNAPSALEEFPQFGQGPGVDDVSWLEPTASRLVDTEPHILKRVYRMRVR
jgi:hypothetical protein